MSCLFCRIAAKQVPSEVLLENEEVLAFRDIHPQAPVHVLLIPKAHVSDVQELGDGKPVSMDTLIAAARQLAVKLGLAENGYRLVINSKADGGQTVDHLHVHLLGGRRMTWPPG